MPMRASVFRVAFGASGTEQRISRNKVLAVISDMSHGGRVQIDWDSPPICRAAIMKLVFLLILCLESALPMAGV